MVDVNGSRTAPGGLEEQRAKRMQIGHQAVKQADALSQLLQRELARDDADEFRDVAPTLFRRIDDLHLVVLDILGGRDVQLDELRQAVNYGEEVDHG